MNKKLIISLTTIAAIALIAIGATTAYFSNTETSTGNTFIAGAIDLKIDNECHLNGRVCVNGFWGDTQEPCTCTWTTPIDLDGKALFYFDDVKPGDDGEDTISLHVDSNPAWVCAEIAGLIQQENGCNTPESIVDETCGDTGEDEGELWDELRFDIWMDDNCDNIWQEEELVLIENTGASNIKWPIADSQHGKGPIREACIGVAWSVPDEVGNIIQGDSVIGDITFSAYQARNNDSFLCNPPQNYCGDNNVDPGEECDGNEPQVCDAAGGYKGIKTCNQCVWSSCEPTERCGDGTINDAEVCDDGSSNGTPNHCNVSCSGPTESTCGNQVVEVGEQCDDGDINNDDGCSSVCQPEPAYIIIHKDVVNNGVGTKSSSNFGMMLDGVLAAQDMQHNVGDTNIHVVSEQDAMDYVKTYSGDCDTNGNITAAWNQTKTCTVTNTMPYGTITVNKTVTNDDGGSLMVGSFTLRIDGGVAASGVAQNVAVGAHGVDEDGVFGYTATFSGDCDSSGNVTVAAGENRICNINNNDVRPSIRLIKIVSGGSAAPDDFDLSIDGAIKTSGSSNPVLANTAHVIDEEVMVSGYNFTSITGSSYLGVSCPAALQETITLLPGDIVTCTITNTH